MPSKENKNGPTAPQISLNNNYTETQPSDITFTEVTRSTGTEKSTNAPKIAVNGVADPKDSKTPSSAESSRQSKDSKQNTSRLPSTEKGKETASTGKVNCFVILFRLKQIKPFSIL